jgi:hypothetical protein
MRRLLVTLLITIPGLLVFMIVWFVNPATATVSDVGPADAVVLFAGTNDRLDTAVDLMVAERAPNLVLPNGMDFAPGLCSAPHTFQVYCPRTETINTEGEARAIGGIATQNGWSRLIAVTSIYHVRRATFLLGQCYDGTVTAVTPSRDIGYEGWSESLPHELAGFLEGIVKPAC